MVRSRLRLAAKRALATLCVSAGLLSIANVDSAWREAEHQDKLELARFHKVVKSNQKRETVSSSAETAGKELRELFETDEIFGVNPFSGLSDSEVIDRIASKSVKAFRRQSLRGPSYSGSFGYDVLLYEIEYKDREMVRLLAYTEREGLSGGHELYVVIMENQNDEVLRSTFASGTLTASESIPLKDAEATVSKRLSSAVPLYTVAR
jgi:hypothetical protein